METDGSYQTVVSLYQTMVYHILEKVFNQNPLNHPLKGLYIESWDIIEWRHSDHQIIWFVYNQITNSLHYGQLNSVNNISNITQNYTIIFQNLTGKDTEGSKHDQIWGSVPICASSGWERRQMFQVNQPIIGLRIKPSIDWKQSRSVSCSTTMVSVI
jgi:hypothetical protein